MTGRRAWPAAVLGAALLAACGATTLPADTFDRTARPTLPPRPTEVSVNGLDPCAFVTPVLRSQLNNLGEQPDRAEPSVGLPGASSCTFVNVPREPSYGLIVRFVSGQGAESRLAHPSAQIASVDGFGAVQRPGLNDWQGDRSCVLILDIAPGQSLWAGVAYTGRGLSPGGYQALCEKATLAARSVLHELRSRRR